MMIMGGNAAFSFRFSFVTEGLGGNAPFFKVFLTIFSVFERQCTVFLTLLGPIFRLGLGRFLGGYAPFYPIITTNLGFDRWQEIFGDPVLTAALVDRITHRAHLVNMEGDSYRLKETKKMMSEK